MSTPHFLNSSHRFFRRVGVTDVQTIIDDFVSETVTNGNPAWTDLGIVAGNRVLQSPNTDGRYMYMKFAALAASQLTLQVTEKTDFYTIGSRQARGSTTHGWDVRIFTGQFHAYIDIISEPGSAESLHAGILDMWPGSWHETYVYMNGTRTFAGAIDSKDDLSYAYMKDQAAVCQNIKRVGVLTGGASTDTGIWTLGGVKTHYCREFWASGPGQVITSSYPGHYAGRAYQTVLVDALALRGSEIIISVDTGVPVRFVTIAGIPSIWGRVLAVRGD